MFSSYIVCYVNETDLINGSILFYLRDLWPKVLQEKLKLGRYKQYTLFKEKIMYKAINEYHLNNQPLYTVFVI